MADKTYVPGLEDNAPSGTPRNSDSEKSNAGGRSFKSGGAGTVIPGDGDSPSERSRSAVKEKDKPVLGFLFSVSRNSFGEYWPLYLGPNTIGRAATCDVTLSEGTVSSEHATLIIHQEDDGEVYAGIKDNGSTHGVKVNGKSAHFDVVGCSNMDIIKIGKNYELLFILIKAEELGLKPVESFVEVRQSSSKQVDKRIITGPAITFNPSPNNTTSRISNPGSNRTRAMDGDIDGPSGGTVSR